MTRVYLDWNATAPLRPEARAAMLEAMDLCGNPSSVHAEGRAARAVLEKARRQVARLAGCEPAEIVFTSGATEAVALAAAQKEKFGGRFLAHPLDHDCVVAWSDGRVPCLLDREGLWDARGAHDYDRLIAALAANTRGGGTAPVALVALSPASGETGIVPSLFAEPTEPDAFLSETSAVATVFDLAQFLGKLPCRPGIWGARFAALSAHKLGGPVGVGALVVRRDTDICAVLLGGGQELGRRSGTENVIGIAGFGAAAEAAERDLEAGVWARVEKLRNILEEGVASAAQETIFVGKSAMRLPNTSCFVTPGWKGETQVMRLDLAGFAVSAGSACSSGKVKESRVLRAMGYDPQQASSAIRVSLGPATTENEVLSFVASWRESYRQWRARRAA